MRFWQRAVLAAAGVAVSCAYGAQGADDSWKRRVIVPQSGVIQPLPNASPTNTGHSPAPDPTANPRFPRNDEFHPNAPASEILRQGPIRFNLLRTPIRAHATNNLQECTAHGGLGGGFACYGLLPNGRAGLVWDWSGSLQLTGYHIYLKDAFGNHLVATQDKGAGVTLFILTAEQSAGGACYVVTAFNASGESDPSNTACIGGGVAVHAVTLYPTQVRSISRKAEYYTGALDSTPDSVADVQITDFEVGYYYDTWKTALGDSAQNVIARGALYFDLASLSGKTIRSAKLTMRVDRTQRPGQQLWQGDLDHESSCVARIGYGTSYWWDHNDWIDAAMALAPGWMQGPDVAYDVTPLVAAWTSGKPNYGMVLLGEEENLKAFTEKTCITAYVAGTFRLTVEYSG